MTSRCVEGGEISDFGDLGFDFRDEGQHIAARENRGRKVQNDKRSRAGVHGRSMMKFTNNPMKFGIFMGPYHKPDLNPMVSFQQDLQTIINLDELGYEEAWIGEHHSGGIETISWPRYVKPTGVRHFGS